MFMFMSIVAFVHSFQVRVRCKVVRNVSGGVGHSAEGEVLVRTRCKAEMVFQ